MTLKDKTILITGGSGSFGQAFVLAALKADARAVRVFSRNEYQQWLMRQQKQFQSSRIRWMIGDVRDSDRLRACMRGAVYVVHAAALKHVSTGQYNPQEVIRTNVEGSVNVVECAASMGVQKVLGISSDKAIAASCLYGSTKQIMETLFLDANSWASPMTRFSILRSGNFMASHGNVFEVWAEQSKRGTIDVTSEAMRRYFIKTADVAKLAVKLLAEMDGREVFVPKMKAAEMMKVAKELYPDCKVNIIGKGDGEKDCEVLFADGEKPVDCGDYWTVKR